MPTRYPGRLISATKPTVTGSSTGIGVFTGVEVAQYKQSGSWSGAPDAPTSISAVGGYQSATVSFVAPANTNGAAITSYTVTSSPGGFTETGSSSPITVNGLTTGTSYTFTVTATNILGTSVSSSASNSVTPAIPVDYFVVAGGGGGMAGLYGGGGGGAGGYLTATGALLTSGVTYTITVGAGGSSTYTGTNDRGANSSISGSGFTTVTSIGGGQGRIYTAAYYSGENGGSGGGASSGSGAVGGKGVYPGSTYLSQARQGYDGAVGSGGGGNQGGGGGGGAAGAGVAGALGGNPSGAGAGGSGVANPFSGSTVGQLVSGTYYLAGGGMGSVETTFGASPGQAGRGGGGTGGNGGGTITTGTAGSPNTGGGGGGGANNVGNSGGSGVVVLRFASTVTVSSTTGSPTVTTPGDGYKYYTFNGNGSITL